MDVSVRLLKHAFSPGRHSLGGNRFLAEIDRTEKRKQHPHLGPTSRTWLLALSWVFLLRFFNCCLLLLLIASYSSAMQPWLESLITFRTRPPWFQTIAWLNGRSVFPASSKKKMPQLRQHFLLFVGMFVNCWTFTVWSRSARDKDSTCATEGVAPLVLWMCPARIQSSLASITLSRGHDGVSLQRKWKDCCWQISADKSSWRDPSSFTQD